MAMVLFLTSISVLLIAQQPLEPPNARMCPLFTAQSGTASAYHPSARSCPSISAIRKWKNLKFGLFMHWGPFAQRVPYDNQYPGASWKLNYWTAGGMGMWKNATGGTVCPPQKDFPNVDCPTESQMNAYRDSYWGMSKTFNPKEFVANDLMAWAAKVGFKYAIPTTKHHDGFAMWDTKAHGAPGQPIYGITGADSPCQRDLIGEMADAARANGLAFGAYFSKADWHAGDYWDAPQTVAGSKEFPKYTGVNYNFTSEQGASTFSRFQNFTKTQLSEIVRKYKPDLLWMDAPWMETNCNETVSKRPLHTPQGYGCRLDAAFKIPDLAAEWSVTAPEMLVVDRGSIDFSAGARQMHPMPYDAASGGAEAYLTPEGGYAFKTNPKLPWETCLTMGPNWAFTNNSFQDNTYRTAGSVIQTLVDVVAKGGNLLLDIGPDEHGQLPQPAVEELNLVGEWLESHGAGIYGTEPVWPYVFNLTRTGADDVNATQMRLVRRGNTVYVHTFLEPSTVPSSSSSTVLLTEPDDVVMHKSGSFHAGGDDAGDGAGAGAGAGAGDGAGDGASSHQPSQPSSCWKLPLPLPLPFVIDGGLDASWPLGAVTSVTLLGEEDQNEEGGKQNDDQSHPNHIAFTSGNYGLVLSGLPTGCLRNSAHVATIAITFSGQSN